MPYIEAQDRNQIMMCSLDPMVDPESIARIIDKFVDGLHLESMGFKKAEAAVEGRPSYDPRCLLKLYLYGSRKKLRSSRKLEEACHLNVEAKWLKRYWKEWGMVSIYMNTLRNMPMPYYAFSAKGCKKHD